MGYKRRKTHKIYSIKLTTEAQRLLDIYKNDNSEYLLAHLHLDGLQKDKAREVIRQSLCVYNKYLKRLGELCELEILLTTYVARYSWANVAKALNYPKDQISEALGHEYGNRITGIYLDNYGNDVIDEMNEKVTGVY